MVAPPQAALDPELLALPAPPRRTRAMAVSLLGVTAVFAVLLMIGLASDVRYAFTAATPDDIGDLVGLDPRAAHGNAFVTARAQLDMGRAVGYARTTESDWFTLAPVVGNERLWVEMRMPSERSLAGFRAPSLFVGRLVPVHSAAFRYRGLGRSSDANGSVMPPLAEDAWVLVDGATPTSVRWSAALLLLIAVFAGYSVTTIGRLLRRVRR